MFRAKTLPSLAQLLSGQPTQDAAALCRHLDVTPQTLKRWLAAGIAPRTASLALFYETPWGYSLINSTAENGAMYARQEAAGLRQEVATLQTRIARLERLAAAGDGFGSANEPLLMRR